MEKDLWKKVVNHPWMVAVGSGVVVLLIQEITPLKLIRNFFVPFLGTAYSFLNQQYLITVSSLIIIFVMGLLVPFGVVLLKKLLKNKINEEDYKKTGILVLNGFGKNSILPI